MAVPVAPHAPKPASRRKREHSRLLREFEQDGTLQSPSITLCIELVAKLFYRHILFRDGSPGSRRNLEWEYKFDIDNFLERKFNVMMPFHAIQLGSPCVIKQRKQRSQCERPSLTHLIKFLTLIFNKLHLNVESSIVSLIYTERLMDKLHISLTPRNWRPIVIAGILTSTKVWDDLSAWNVEFSNLLPLLSLKSINKLEGLYLTALDYDLYISSSEYAKYYFALRGLKNVKCHKIPRYYLDMKIAPLGPNFNNSKDRNDRNHRSNRLETKQKYLFDIKNDGLHNARGARMGRQRDSNTNNINNNNNNNMNGRDVRINGSKNLNDIDVTLNIRDEKAFEEEKYGLDGKNLFEMEREERKDEMVDDAENELMMSQLSDNLGNSLIGAGAASAVKEEDKTLQRSLLGDEDYSMDPEYLSLRSEYDTVSKVSFASDHGNASGKSSNKLESVIETEQRQGRKKKKGKGKGKGSQSAAIQIRQPKPNTMNRPLLMPLSVPDQNSMDRLKDENRPRY